MNMANPNTPRPGTPGSATPGAEDRGNEVRGFTSDAGLGRGGSGSETMQGNSDVISTLNDLIETSRDGEKGFALAAKDTKNPSLAEVFAEGERSCREAVRELQEKVRALGGKPDEGGSVKGAVHRGWLSLKTAATSRDDKAILEECERGEDYAKARYAAALKTNLSNEVRQMVERQYHGAVANHDRIRDLRNQYRDQ
jgi:uncharacterized protein (TIGR02284 family)